MHIITNKKLKTVRPLICLLAVGLGSWTALPTAWGEPVVPRQDTLHLNYADSGPFGHYFTYCFDPIEQAKTGSRAVVLWEGGHFRPMPRADGVLQGGHRPDRLWLRATVVNTLPQRTHFVWSLYEYVDSATLYVQPAGKGLPRAAGGASSRVVAASRPFPARAVCLPFWLDAHAQGVLYVRVENHTGVWCLPTDMSTAEGFLRFETTYLAYTHWAWLLGLYIGSAIFNLVLFAFLRNRIHLWYVAYVLFCTWFLLMEDSIDALLLPQWAYGVGWRLGEFGVLLLALACGLRIMALFMRLRQGWPRLHRLSWMLSTVAGGYAIAYACLVPGTRPWGNKVLAGLNNTRDVLVWGLLLTGTFTLGVVVWQGRRTQRQIAGFYAVTYGFFLAGAAELMLAYSGMTYSTFVEPNILAWGLALELLTLSVLLTGRFRRALLQKNDQRLRRLRERTAAGQHLIQAQDEEREALARELHDALAPGLTAMHLAWQGRRVRQALTAAAPVLTAAHELSENLLRQLRHDVRTLGQALLPMQPGEQPPLPVAVALLAEALNLAEDGPRLSCSCDAATADLPVPLQAAAYRIAAELLHNALRHAQARHVRIEVRRLPASLRLHVEDDGRGFDPLAVPPLRGGLGLRGVKARAGYLGGTVLLSSQPGRGTAVTVELPLR